MKNPHITATLQRIMKTDRTIKLELIGCIISHYKDSNPLLDEVTTFDKLYDLCISDLNDLISNCISDQWSVIYNLIADNNRKI